MTHNGRSPIDANGVNNIVSPHEKFLVLAFVLLLPTCNSWADEKSWFVVGAGICEVIANAPEADEYLLRVADTRVGMYAAACLLSLDDESTRDRAEIKLIQRAGDTCFVDRIVLTEYFLSETFNGVVLEAQAKDAVAINLCTLSGRSPATNTTFESLEADWYDKLCPHVLRHIELAESRGDDDELLIEYLEYCTPVSTLN